jgi:hypothetical protein
MKKVVKLKDFLVNFKNEELENIEDLDLGEIGGELEGEYRNLLNKFFDREVEDREIVLDDLDCKDGFLYKLVWEWCENEFVVENNLRWIGYGYSLEDLFRDTFGIGRGFFELFDIEDINKKLYPWL